MNRGSLVWDDDDNDGGRQDKNDMKCRPQGAQCMRQGGREEEDSRILFE